MSRAVSELEAGNFAAQRPNRALMADRSEAEDGAEARQRGDARRQEIAALVDFSAHRLVLRRDAAHGVRHHAASQRQPVVGARVESAIGPAEFRQRAVEQVARIISGERAPRTVRPGDAGREADDQKRRVRIAEAFHCAVKPVRVLR